MTEPDGQSPFAGIDMARLDADFLSLLHYAAADGHNRYGRLPAGQGLTLRERRLFRFGLLAGLGEWSPAGEFLNSLADEGLLAGPELERAAAEAGLVMGWPACRHLGPTLAARGLRAPANVAAAVQTANAGLPERELFALGLGITWGARCWDT